MSNQLNALILNHTNADVAIRERIAFSDAEAVIFLEKLYDADFESVMIISTCNRTEIYFDEGEENAQFILSYIQQIKNVDNTITDRLIFLNDVEETVIHLARVSMGLESLILGDLQIFNQVKRAYQLSIDKKLASPRLHRLMHTIFYAHKKVVKETDFSMGISSVSYAVAEITKKKIKEFVDPKILVVGLGGIGDNIVKNLIQLTRNEIITVTNRTDGKAQCIAARNEVNYLPFSEFKSHINLYDIVIFAISVENYMLTKEDIKVEQFRHKYFFDLCVPRVLAPNIDEIPGVVLYNIDEIQLQLTENQTKRTSSIKQVEEIIHVSCTEYFTWVEKQVTSTAIKLLKSEFERIRINEIKKYNSLNDISHSELEALDRISQSMIKKILSFHMVQFNTACKRGEPETIIGVINELFNVENSNR